MKLTFRFKSVLIIPDKTGKTDILSFDIENARSHMLETGPGAFMLNRSWISSFFIALMVIVPLSALVYGILSAGLKLDMEAVRPWFIISCGIAFIFLLASMGIPASARRLKWELVVNDRGNGNWKLIDDAAWDHFTRMIRLVEERKRQEKEKREEEKAKQPSWPTER